MTLLDQITLERLWAKYEKRFGAPPPLRSASIPEAIAFLRRELSAADTGTNPAFRVAIDRETLHDSAMCAP